MICLQKKAAEKKEKETKKSVVQCDDLLTFRQFSKKAADDVIDVSLLLMRNSVLDIQCFFYSMTRMLGVLPALGKFKKTSFPVSAGSPNSLASLMLYMPRHMSKSTALISYSVRNTYTIETLMMLIFPISFQDVLLVNQTADTLQNLCLDFATLGDLKLVERPTIHTLAPHSFLSIKATIKVCSFSLISFDMHSLLLYRSLRLKLE